MNSTVIQITDVNEKLSYAMCSSIIVLRLHLATFTLNQFCIHRSTNQLLHACSTHHITSEQNKHVTKVSNRFDRETKKFFMLLFNKFLDAK